jgi:hypothetical protein
MEMTLEEEQHRLQELLKGRVVARVHRHRKKEVCIVFADGWRLFVDWEDGGSFDFSVTEGPVPTED